ncbi:MAG: hypothetical protein Q9173_001197 [Seirophora scorigena]
MRSTSPATVIEYKSRTAFDQPLKHSRYKINNNRTEVPTRRNFDMQLRSGHDTLALQEEQALMRELYPTPDPETHRASPETLMMAVEQISKDKELGEDERLRQFHRMLELCAAEHEREVQGYQAAHRHLMEDEADLGRLLTYPKVPQQAFDAWERGIRDDRSQLKNSRERTEEFLRASKYIERRSPQVEFAMIKLEIDAEVDKRDEQEVSEDYPRERKDGQKLVAPGALG